MNTDTKKVSVVLDTNILISSIGFGGKPRKILNLALERKLQVISSPILLAELDDVISKKFPLLAESLKKIHKHLNKRLKIVNPKKSLHIVRDEPDNRVLEAALQGKCQYIVTGDRDLLDIGTYGKIKIVTPNDFLTLFENN